MRKTRVEGITPFLWFDDRAEEAAKFYVSVFGNSRIVGLSRYGEGAPRPAGSVMVVSFELEGRRFQALNGGPVFSFTPAVSFLVTCTTQEEVDRLWRRLTRGGTIQQCGWLTDRFGVTWQIVPRLLLELMGDRNPRKAAAVTQAMLKMKKLDGRKLQRAYDRA